MKGFLRRAWHFLRWPLGILLLAYIGLVIYRIPHFAELDKTQKTIAKIEGQKVNLDDVMGKNLPPAPDPALADATLAGVDANDNGIRDDVELAIFKLHPHSARIRAAELQYALALQNELVQTFNTSTFIFTLQEVGRAGLCIADAAPKVQASDSHEIASQKYAIPDTLQSEVKDLILNNDQRKIQFEENFKYNSSYGDLEEVHCDIPLSTLPN